MSGKICETKRLIFREFNEIDAESIYRLNLDNEVLKFTGDKPFKSIMEAHIFLKQYDHYEKYGFGRWAVINKGNDEFIGWSGLKYMENQVSDLGFRFFRRYWNQGYATESAIECLEVGFNQLRMKRTIGRAQIENKASIKVLKKIDMNYWKEQIEDEWGHVVYYEIKKNRR